MAIELQGKMSDKVSTKDVQSSTSDIQSSLIGTLHYYDAAGDILLAIACAMLVV